MLATRFWEDRDFSPEIWIGITFWRFFRQKTKKACYGWSSNSCGWLALWLQAKLPRTKHWWTGRQLDSISSSLALSKPAKGLKSAPRFSRVTTLAYGLWLDAKTNMYRLHEFIKSLTHTLYWCSLLTTGQWLLVTLLSSSSSHSAVISFFRASISVLLMSKTVPTAWQLQMILKMCEAGVHGLIGGK